MKNIVLIGLLCCSFSTFAQKTWSLSDCILYAIENNISIKQSKLDLETSEIDKRGAVGNFLPNLNSNLSHSWQNGLTSGANNVNLVRRQQNSNIGISTEVVLYDGLRNIRQLHRANLGILANQYQLDDMKDNITLNIINAYLQVAFNKETLKTVKRQFEINEAEFDRSKELAAAGTIPQGDLLELESNLATQSQQIINAENQVRIAQINLANILSIVDYKSFKITDSIAITSTTILEKTPFQIYLKALETRNDIKNAEVAVGINEDNLRLSKGVYHPTLSGGYNFRSNYYNDNIDRPTELPQFWDQLNDNKSHNFYLSLRIPIFNRLQNSNGVRRSKVNLEKSKLALEQAKIDLKSKVNQSYNDVLSAFAVFEASEKTLAARKESFRYSQEKFDLGLMNSFDYSLARLRYENAENDVIKSKYDYFFKAKVLEFYFGIPLY
ncbi:TolC family protein [Flavicella marina]|uniref:TolC family protein n=1 Tax=Flavicella marina TaxID=1475951 RepID=UPI0012643BFA|nr:TolC family protein [Flavicella marina]